MMIRPAPPSAIPPRGRDSPGPRAGLRGWVGEVLAVAGGDRSGQEMGLRQQWLVTSGASGYDFDVDRDGFNEYRQIWSHPGPSEYLEPTTLEIEANDLD